MAYHNVEYLISNFRLVKQASEQTSLMQNEVSARPSESPLFSTMDLVNEALHPESCTCAWMLYAHDLWSLIGSLSHVLE